MLIFTSRQQHNKRVQVVKIVTFLLDTYWKCVARCIVPKLFSFSFLFLSLLHHNRWSCACKNKTTCWNIHQLRRVTEKKITKILRAIASKRKNFCNKFVFFFVLWNESSGERNFSLLASSLTCRNYFHLFKEIKKIKNANLSWCLTFILSHPQLERKKKTKPFLVCLYNFFFFFFFCSSCGFFFFA